MVGIEGYDTARARTVVVVGLTELSCTVTVVVFNLVSYSNQTNIGGRFCYYCISKLISK